MKNIIKKEYFIPARALQNLGNPEFSTLTEKLRLALIRYTRFQNYNSFYLGPHPLPVVFIEKKFLKTEPLGYAVLAEISG